jgi:hypothetical protein
VRFIALIPAVVAAALSYGSTVSFILALINGALSFFAINAILNPGTQPQAGETIDSFETYKSRAVALLTITWIVAIFQIVEAVV